MWECIPANNAGAVPVDEPETPEVVLLRIRLVAIAILVFPPVSAADSIWDQIEILDDSELEIVEEKDQYPAFGGQFELGYLATTGNTENTSTNSRLLLAVLQEDWKHGLVLQAVRVTEDETLTAERYQGAYKSEYSLTEYNYLFGTVNYERDEFAGFTRRLSEAVGYGRRFLNEEDLTLDAELGVGARQTNFVDGTRRSERIIRAASSFYYGFNDTGSFSQNISVESGSSNTYTESVTSVSSTLVGELQLQVSYTVKHNSTVPVGNVKTDTYTSVSVVYTF